MNTKSTPLTKLYDQKNELFGVLLSPELWEEAKSLILPLLEKNAAQEEAPEPVKDWNMLLDYWDFQYPPDTKVECEQCGNVTEDWMNPVGKTFRLKAANLGGLVNFQCLKCQSRIIKRHFKDNYRFECHPNASMKKNP